MAAPPRDCPCHAPLRYADCCAPFHQGVRAAPTPAALMRSRYSAFALGLGDYLVDTLAEGHESHAVPRAILVKQLASARATQRFQGLEIVFESDRGSEGEVLFVARIFEKGQDRSFAELSTFTREAGRWRYASGVLLPAAELPRGEPLTVECFLRLAAGRA